MLAVFHIEVINMTFPLQITFRRMAHSPSIEQLIQEKAAKLNNFSNQIISGKVVVDLPHRHHQSGNQFHLAIEISTRQGKIVVNREEGDRDIFIAVREAFASAARKLEESQRINRHEVKMHESPPLARIVRIFPDKGYGFLETPDGREVYFHQNSVINGNFERLLAGDPVTFSEESGEEGPQATFVRVVGL